MIKAIIFDWGGVLSDDNKIDDFCKENKYGINPEKLNHAMNEFWKDVRVDELDSSYYWERISQSLNIDKNAFRKDLLEFCKLKEDIYDLVKKLKNEYKLAMLSNHIRDWLEEKIKDHGLKDVFDVIVTSYDSKLAKPDPEIYKFTCKKLGLKLEECVFIDDMKSNLLPAKELGMNIILFQNLDQLKQDLSKLGVNV